MLIPDPQVLVITGGKKVIFRGNAGKNGGIRAGDGMADLVADKWQRWPDP